MNILLSIMFIIAILYLWWQIFKLKILVANIILQEKSKELLDEYNLKGGHNIERN